MSPITILSWIVVLLFGLAVSGASSLEPDDSFMLEPTDDFVPPTALSETGRPNTARILYDDMQAQVGALMYQPQIDPDLFSLLWSVSRLPRAALAKIQTAASSHAVRESVSFLRFLISLAVALSSRPEPKAQYVSYQAVAFATHLLKNTGPAVRDYTDRESSFLLGLLCYRLTDLTQFVEDLQSLIEAMSSQTLGVRNLAGENALIIAIRTFPTQVDLLRTLYGRMSVQDIAYSCRRSLTLPTLSIWVQVFHDPIQGLLAQGRYDVPRVLNTLQIQCEPSFRYECGLTICVRTVWYDAADPSPSLAPFVYAFRSEDAALLAHYDAMVANDLLLPILRHDVTNAEWTKFVHVVVAHFRADPDGMRTVISQCPRDPARIPFLVAVRELAAMRVPDLDFFKFAQDVSKLSLQHNDLPTWLDLPKNSNAIVIALVVNMVRDEGSSPRPCSFEDRFLEIVRAAARSPSSVFGANLAKVAGSVLVGVVETEPKLALVLLGRLLSEKGIFRHEAALNRLCLAIREFVDRCNSHSALLPIFIRFCIILLNNEIVMRQVESRLYLPENPLRETLSELIEVIPGSMCAVPYLSCPPSPALNHLFSKDKNGFQLALQKHACSLCQEPLAGFILKPTSPKDITAHGEICAICMCRNFADGFRPEDPDLTGRSPSVVLRCGHLFHTDCIQTSLESSVLCPMCRGDVFVPDRESLNRLRTPVTNPADHLEADIIHALSQVSHM